MKQQYYRIFENWYSTLNKPGITELAKQSIFDFMLSIISDSSFLVNNTGINEFLLAFSSQTILSTPPQINSFISALNNELQNALRVITKSDDAAGTNDVMTTNDGNDTATIDDMTTNDGNDTANEARYSFIQDIIDLQLKSFDFYSQNDIYQNNEMFLLLVCMDIFPSDDFVIENSTPDNKPVNDDFLYNFYCLVIYFLEKHSTNFNIKLRSRPNYEYNDLNDYDDLIDYDKNRFKYAIICALKTLGMDLLNTINIGGKRTSCGKSKKKNKSKRRRKIKNNNKIKKTIKLKKKLRKTKKRNKIKK